MGWHPTEGSVAEGPLQGAAGAVGDKAPRGRGRELKLAGTTSWPSSLPPAGAPTPGPVAREPLERLGGWRAWDLGWGSMTPHGYQHGEHAAGEGTATSDSRGRDVTPARTDKKALHTGERKRRRGLDLPKSPLGTDLNNETRKYSDEPHCTDD